MDSQISSLVEQLQHLDPREREQWLQRFAFELADAGEVYALSDEERALVREGLRDLDAGRVATDEQMRAFWSRHQR